MGRFRHPHLVRGFVYTPNGAFAIVRGIVEVPDAVGESLGWLRAEEDGFEVGTTPDVGRRTDALRYLPRSDAPDAHRGSD